MNFRRIIGIHGDNLRVGGDDAFRAFDAVFQMSADLNLGAGMDDGVFDHGIFADGNIMRDDGMIHFTEYFAAVANETIGHFARFTDKLGMTAGVVGKNAERSIVEIKFTGLIQKIHIQPAFLRTLIAFFCKP